MNWYVLAALVIIVLVMLGLTRFPIRSDVDEAKREVDEETPEEMRRHLAEYDRQMHKSDPHVDSAEWEKDDIVK